MSRKRKKTYQSEQKPQKLITITGEVGLLYVDQEQLKNPALGDLGVFPNCDELHMDDGESYYALGFNGYFRVDVWDGKKWCPVVLSEVFPGREHYFSKKDMPIDVYERCKDILLDLDGEKLLRTYREHYELFEEEDADE